MEFLLNTVRMIDNDQAREFSIGTESSLNEKLAIAFINPKDYDKLNLEPDKNLKIMNEMGEIIVKVKNDDNIQQRTVLMPVSIWSNQLTTIINNEINYKNIKVTLEATNENPLGFKELIQRIKGSK